jgi:hypothetical protein
MNRYWSDHPPVHILVAAYMGIKPKAEDEDDASLDDLLNAFGGAGVVEKK